MFLLTSNPNKIKEYKELGIEARLGVDVKEVQGTIDEVIIYKILSHESFILVEDTVLVIDDEEIVDIKFKLKNLKKDSKALWITSLGYHDNINLYVYRGFINGMIVSPVIDHPTSFAPYFLPENSNFTLYELMQQGKKHEFSARRIAIDSYHNAKPLFFMKVLDVPKWEGHYQENFIIRK